MPVLDQSNQLEVKRYIEFVSNFPNAHYYQDYRWQYVHNNLKTEYVYIEENGKIVAACCFYIRPIALGLSILYGQRGPICDLKDSKMIKRIIEEAKPLVKQYHAFMFKFDPNIQDDDSIRANLKKNGFTIRGKGFTKLDLILSRRSMVIHLNGRNMQELAASFKRGTRYNFNKSLRNGLEVVHGYTKENLDAFMEILKITALRDNIEYKPREFFENIFNNYDESIARLYLIKHEGEVLAGCLGINYGGRLMYYHSGSSNNKRELLPNYLMMHALMSWAIEEKCDIYDFGGIIAEDLSDGLWVFKSGFCNGEKMDEYIGELDYPCNKILYLGFKMAYWSLQRVRRLMYLVRVKLKRQG